MCLRHGVDMIYHATLADDEAKDMLEAAKDRVFVAPAIGLPYARLRDAELYGVATSDYIRARAEKEIEVVSATMAELHRRGVRVMPGGDYGFKWNPHGKNARDLAMFVECFGFTPLEAIRTATEWGGQLMGPSLGLGNGLGQVSEGFLADLLLVDGDPSRDIEILQDRDRLLAIMKDGDFHKAPPSEPLVRRQAAE
jgi:imidazolonepropionase-like amidohydrolase